MGLERERERDSSFSFLGAGQGGGGRGGGGALTHRSAGHQEVSPSLLVRRRTAAPGLLFLW